MWTLAFGWIAWASIILLSFLYLQYLGEGGNNLHLLKCSELECKWWFISLLPKHKFQDFFQYHSALFKTASTPYWHLQLVFLASNLFLHSHFTIPQQSSHFPSSILSSHTDDICDLTSRHSSINHSIRGSLSRSLPIKTSYHHSLSSATWLQLP